MKAFTSKPLELPKQRDLTSRADLVFYGVDHSGPSYLAHIFLGNPDANANTPLELESGYVGSFSVFGHGGCFGDEGHCHPTRPTSDAFDRRGPHPLEPFTRSVEITKELSAFTKAKAVIAVVPVVSEVEGISDPDIAPTDFVRLAVYEE